MSSMPVRIVIISEDARERQQLANMLQGLPDVEIAAEVDLVCQMGKQAGQVNADCVVLDIDQYPLAGTLGLAQARGTFPGVPVILLTRSIPPRYLQFLKKSGAKCCIDKSNPDKLTQFINVLQMFAEVDGGRSARQTANQHI